MTLWGMDWISVNDKLPELNNKLRSPPLVVSDGLLVWSSVYKCKDGNCFFTYPSEFGPLVYEGKKQEITHWMLLLDVLPKVVDHDKKIFA